MVSGKPVLLQRRITGSGNRRTSPRSNKSQRRSTPGTVGAASRISTPVPSGSLYKSWRSSLSTNGSSLDKIQEDKEEVDFESFSVQQCLFTEEVAKIPEEAAQSTATKKTQRPTRRTSMRRSVIFGPALSPEYFDKTLPPSTPLKKGALPTFSASFVGDQPPCELEQIQEESFTEAKDSSYSELVGKSKSPQASPATRTKAASPAKKGGHLSAKLQRNTRKSLGGNVKKRTRQNRSSLPASLNSSTVGLVGVPKGKIKMVEAAVKTHKQLKRLATPIREEIHKRPKLRKTKKNTKIKRRSIGEDTTDGARLSVSAGNKANLADTRRSFSSSASVSIVKDTPDLMEEDEVADKKSEIYMSLPTPLKTAIHGGIPLRRTKPTLYTPLREDLKKGTVLHKVYKTLPTPVRKEITTNPPKLQTTRKQLSTKLSIDVQTKSKLKKSLPTPIREEIASKPRLHATTKSLPTPLRKEIENSPPLRKTKKSLPTPLRKEIESSPPLRPIRRAMPTPLRKEIESSPLLRKTKKSLPTPLRKEIESSPPLHPTRRAMPTPLRKEIESSPPLRPTRRAMPTPLRKEIESSPPLRKTKKSLPTPLRKEIESSPPLRRTKRAMPTPLRKEIESSPPLRKTKKSLPTPLQKEIESSPPLRRTKRAMPTPLRKEIESSPPLRRTKRAMPTPLRKEIESSPPLRRTRRAMPTPLRKEIESSPPLRKTKKSLPTPLRKEIESSPPLRPTRRACQLHFEKR